MFTNKNGFALFKKGLEIEVKQIGLFVEYTRRAHEDCIVGIYNTWCEIIHVENKLH